MAAVDKKDHNLEESTSSPWPKLFVLLILSYVLINYTSLPDYAIQLFHSTTTSSDVSNEDLGPYWHQLNTQIIEAKRKLVRLKATALDRDASSKISQQLLEKCESDKNLIQVKISNSNDDTVEKTSSSLDKVILDPDGTSNSNSKSNQVQLLSNMDSGHNIGCAHHALNFLGPCIKPNLSISSYLDFHRCEPNNVDSILYFHTFFDSSELKGEISYFLDSYIITQNLQNSLLTVWTDSPIEWKKASPVIQKYRDLDAITFKTVNYVDLMTNACRQDNHALVKQSAFRKSHPQAIQNLRRFLILHQYGGTWIDSNYIFLKNLRPLHNYIDHFIPKPNINIDSNDDDDDDYVPFIMSLGSPKSEVSSFIFEKICQIPLTSPKPNYKNPLNSKSVDMNSFSPSLTDSKWMYYVLSPFLNGPISESLSLSLIPMGFFDPPKSCSIEYPESLTLISHCTNRPHLSQFDACSPETIPNYLYGGIMVKSRLDKKDCLTHGINKSTSVFSMINCRIQKGLTSAWRDGKFIPENKPKDLLTL